MKRLTPASASKSWVWQRSDWPDFRWDIATLSRPLAAARRAQGELVGAARLLGTDDQTQAEAALVLQDALNTSLIEGQHPDPQGVRSSIAQRLGLPSAGLPAPDKEADGLVAVLLDATAHYHAPLDLERLSGWQAALFPDGRSSLRRIRTGALRGKQPMQIVSGPVGRERVHYEAIPHTRLRADMQKFLRWFAHPPTSLDGLLRAGIAHLWFELIHPFEDGNGRVGRALMDMALAQDEGLGTRLYSLSAQFMKERDHYYRLLEEAGRADLDITEWLRWFLLQIEAACRSAQMTLDNVIGKTRFWMRHALTPLNERQRKALNRLLDAGPGGFEGGMTTRKYSSLAKVSRATAYRELSQLVELGCIVANDKGGRSMGYDIAWADI